MTKEVKAHGAGSTSLFQELGTPKDTPASVVELSIECR